MSPIGLTADYIRFYSYACDHFLSDLLLRLNGADEGLPLDLKDVSKLGLNKLLPHAFSDQLDNLVTAIVHVSPHRL
jgi:hypothetical protein